jgi:DNA-binding NarL/FixJ family response regulator
MGSPGDTSLLRRIRTVAPQARVIVYSGYLSIVNSDELGGDADAYLAKSDDEAMLVKMIREVAQSSVT